EMILLGAGIVATAALYPNLYLASAFLGLGICAAIVWRAVREPGLGTPAVDVAGWTAAGVIAGYFIIEGYNEGRALPAFALSSVAGLVRKSVSVTTGLGVFAVGALWYWR